MNNLTSTIFSGIFAGALLAVSFNANAHDSFAAHKADGVEKLQLANLMKAKLAGAEGTEVIVSRVAIPPNTTLPTHWHPGEEFAYVIDGEVTLWQKGKDDIIVKKGDTAKVPLKQIHTAKTGNEAAVILVFRVHEEGQPERVKAN